MLQISLSEKKITVGSRRVFYMGHDKIQEIEKGDAVTAGIDTLMIKTRKKNFRFYETYIQKSDSCVRNAVNVLS